MSELGARPDPDILLRRLQEEEARAKRGKLRIFFGFAPGVGKTYRMLQVARDLATEQHVDVVVGVAEDHGREETARLMYGIEVLARRKVQYRGHTLEEFDLDAALGVVPQVEHVWTRRRVHRDALAARDVADNPFAADRIAAARAHDEHVVEATHLDLVLSAGAQHALDHTGDGAVGRPFAKRILGHDSGNHGFRGELAA